MVVLVAGEGEEEEGEGGGEGLKPESFLLVLLVQ